LYPKYGLNLSAGPSFTTITIMAKFRYWLRALIMSYLHPEHSCKTENLERFSEFGISNFIIHLGNGFFSNTLNLLALAIEVVVVEIIHVLSLRHSSCIKFFRICDIFSGGCKMENNL